jgi:hypothetical protein
LLAARRDLRARRLGRCPRRRSRDVARSARNIDFDQTKEELKTKYHDYVWAKSIANVFYALPQAIDDSSSGH